MVRLITPGTRTFRYRAPVVLKSRRRELSAIDGILGRFGESVVGRCVD
jgi:hypothetical protein